MARTEIYFDASATGANDGSSPANAFTDLNAGIKATTFDTVNGNRCNLNGSFTVTERVDVSMDDAVTTAAWVPSYAAHCVFEGYTAAAGDGGLATIDGNGASVFNKSAANYISLRGITFTNSGANNLVRLGTYCSITKCVFHNASAAILLQVSSYALVTYNRFYNGGGTHLSGILGWYVGNIFDLELNTPQYGISSPGAGFIADNIFKNVNGTSLAMKARQGSVVVNNSIYSNGGTGKGIGTDGSNCQYALIANNLIEGFSGAGGVGIDLSATAGSARALLNNRIFNCDTEIATLAVDAVWSEQNTVLSASPFTDAAGGDFSPVNVDSIKENVIPADFYEA